MRKAMIIVSVIIGLLLVGRALFTGGGVPGLLRRGNCPGTGLSGSGNNLCGVSTPSRIGCLACSARDRAFRPKLCGHTIPASNPIRYGGMVRVGPHLSHTSKRGRLALFPFIHIAPGDASFAVHM